MIGKHGGMEIVRRRDLVNIHVIRGEGGRKTSILMTVGVGNRYTAATAQRRILVAMIRGREKAPSLSMTPESPGLRSMRHEVSACFRTHHRAFPTTKSWFSKSLKTSPFIGPSIDDWLRRVMTVVEGLSGPSKNL